MNYIILDNEWNTVYNKQNDTFLNELIEIGAVKLDKKLKEIDRFSVLIRSSFTKKLSGRFKRLTHITNEEMLSEGIPFEEAIERYKEWVGEDVITLTWSDSDIYTILANMKHFYGIDDIPFIEKYVDLQKFAQQEIRERGFKIDSQISVANAAELLEIEFDESLLHRALDDCLLTAEIFRKVYSKTKLKKVVIDTSDAEYYKKLVFKPYLITDINSKDVSLEKLKFKCPKCRIRAIKCGEWKFNRFAFKAPYYCKKCKDDLIASVTYKKHYDYVAVKKKIVSKKDAEHKPKEIAIVK